MKVFTVYKHESKGYEAVKVGFSWTGLLLNAYIPWWMLWKGFLFLAITFGTINFGFIYLLAEQGIGLADLPETPNGWFMLSIQFLINLIPGFYGNSWLNKKYKNKGYTELKAIPASSKEAAIALAKNEEVENSPSIKSQDVIEEGSELFYEKAYSLAYDEIKGYEKDGKVELIKNSDLWARAFAESDGDENKQKVIYVKLRAKELDYEYDFEFKQGLNKKRNKRDLYIFISFASLIAFFFLVIN